jgi:hypothetical protein
MKRILLCFCEKMIWELRNVLNDNDTAGLGALVIKLDLPEVKTLRQRISSFCEVTVRSWKESYM